MRRARLLGVCFVFLCACEDEGAAEVESSRAEITALRADVAALRARLDETEAKVEALEAKVSVSDERLSKRRALDGGRVGEAGPSGAIEVLERAEKGDLRCPKEGECQITRSFLEELLANPSLLARQARIIPGREGVTPRGVKIFGIRSDSLANLLGFKNGDTILSVNGHSLNSPDEALEAYAKLKSTNELSFAVERRGEPITITVTLVEQPLRTPTDD